VSNHPGPPGLTLPKIERAARRLDIAEFIEVAQALGVDPSKIIKKLLADKMPAS
jgi:hypothetical protein